MENALELVHLFDKFKFVKGFVFDVDGVFTDNALLVTDQGELLRTMNVRDGQAVKWAVKAGFEFCVITGGRSPGVTSRLSALGIQDIYSNIQDKWQPFSQFLQRSGLSPKDICYMGDDLPDLPILRKVGLPACPYDAVPEVLDIAEYISPLKGGYGCVRDLLEKVMKIQGKWPVF
jgi:3-deoxy-D-manno-octulosonate 8-phosphate phosphatase (KDO 8-P phosphatase)